MIAPSDGDSQIRTGASHDEFDVLATAMALNITEEAEGIVIRAILDKIVQIMATLPVNIDTNYFIHVFGVDALIDIDVSPSDMAHDAQGMDHKPVKRKPEHTSDISTMNGSNRPNSF